MNFVYNNERVNESKHLFYTCQGWAMVRLLVELIFSFAISNAKVERLFFLMNRVKTDSQAALSANTQQCHKNPQRKVYHLNSLTPRLQLTYGQQLQRAVQIRGKGR
jgi:hypothetical protein